MTKARIGALFLLLAAVGAATFALARGEEQERRGVKPVLMLLTSLPLVFGEEFSIDQKGSSTLGALRSRYRVVPVDVTDSATLAKGSLLMMAQPRAQTADNLVALDDWVRRGGRVLLFADPLLEWPSDKPLGDPTRPPRMFADTGLLGHWGLRLDAPDTRGPVDRTIGSKTVLTVSPGSLAGSCAIDRGGLVARCNVGKGTAIIVADADLLDVDGLGDGAANNVQAVLAQLDSVESR
ncbi:MAG: DUF4350 domain-containing protein [Sphingomicrobium sp.]